MLVDIQRKYIMLSTNAKAFRGSFTQTDFNTDNVNVWVRVYVGNGQYEGAFAEITFFLFWKTQDEMLFSLCVSLSWCDVTDDVHSSLY